jgi:AcrR family transcriptional regulator
VSRWAAGKPPAKRQAIIDAAQRVFLAQGFAGSSVDAIAGAAGASKQTICNHFGDKEALFRAVVRAVHSGLTGDFHEAGLEERLASSDGLGRDLRELGRAADGRRALTEAEAGQIVDNGAEMWLRCYRPVRSQQ